MVLEIPDHDRRRFVPGAEAAGIWAWLQSRGGLDRLPAALHRIKREDLSAILATPDDSSGDFPPWNGERPDDALALVPPAHDDPRVGSESAAPASESLPAEDPGDAVLSGGPPLRTWSRVTSRIDTAALLSRLLFAVAGTVAVLLPLGTITPLPIGWFAAAVLPVCVGWALRRSWITYPMVHRWKHPATTVKIVLGDIFAQDAANVVVGFTDTFDTCVTDPRIIAKESLQGQLVYRRYGGDHRRLDGELVDALAGHPTVVTESRAIKPLGKLDRYAIGTVAVLGRPGRHTFLVAYSHMGNDLVPRSSANRLWLSLNGLWDALDRHGQRLPVAMPVVGSGLARIDSLTPQNLIYLILLSFIARSRESPVCRELRLVVWPGDIDRYHLPELARFLRQL